jgi:hypothetical protein
MEQIICGGRPSTHLEPDASEKAVSDQSQHSRLHVRVDSRNTAVRVSPRHCGHRGDGFRCVECHGQVRPRKKGANGAGGAGAYFSKPRMYGTTGGRGPVLNSGPRVDR